MDALFQFIEKYMKLSPEERDFVLSTSRKRSWEKNSIIKTFNEASNQSYFVLSGCVCALYQQGEVEAVSEFFFEGEPVLLTHDNYQLRCLEDTSLSVTENMDSEKSMQAFPRFEQVCRQFAEEKLAQILRLSDRMRTLGPMQRMELLQTERPEVFQRVPQHLIASYLGIAPETLSRLRKQKSSNKVDHQN